MVFMSEQASRDESLGNLAIRQARNGQIEAARQTASQITDRSWQRRAWMGILYAQFFISMDLEDVRVKETLEELRAVKETLSIISDHSLWYGSWVLDLLHALVKAGDSVGAVEIAGRINNPVYRGLHYGDIAAWQAMNNDSEGVEQTLNLLCRDPDRLVEKDIDMLDLALGRVAREYARVRGDIELAKQYATRIGEANERERILKRIEEPSPWSS